jgi:ABC-type sugar transport system substrate-binding protein
MRKRVGIRSRLAIAAFLALLLAAGIGAKAQGKTEKQYKIGIDNGSGYGFPFPAAEGKGVVSVAKKLGVKVVANLDGKNDPQKEAANVQDLIALHPDGVLMMPSDAAEAASLVDKMVAAKIKVISVHSVVGANRKLTDVYPKLTALVIEDEVGAGKTAGEMAKRALPKGGKVAVVLGQAGYAEVGLRLSGFKAGIKGSKLKLVAQQPGDWTATKGQAACQGMLSGNPDIALFFSESDDMGVGCAKAVKNSGSKAKVIGVGGSKLGMAAIKTGGAYYGTVCYKPYTEGQIAMKRMYDNLRGTKHDKHKLVFYATPGITKANASKCVGQW